MKKILFLIIILLAFSCSNNPSSGEHKCDNKCDTVGVNQCSDDTLMVCQKDKDGCLVLTEVKKCQNACKDNACIEQNNECNPTCKDWELCDDNLVCKLKEDKCNTKDDCSDNKVCDENHSCVENQTVKKSTKIVMGAGGKSKSASFKLKLNVGKIKSIKKLKSASYKMKVGNLDK